MTVIAGYFAGLFFLSSADYFSRVEAELILAFLLQQERLYLYLHGEEKLPERLEEEHWDPSGAAEKENRWHILLGKRSLWALNFV